MGKLIKGIIIFLVVYIVLYFMFAVIPEEIGWKTLRIVMYTLPGYLFFKIIKWIRLVAIKENYNKKVEEFAALLMEICKRMGMFTIPEVFDEVTKNPMCTDLLAYLCSKIKYSGTQEDYVTDYISIFCDNKKVERKCMMHDEAGRRTGMLYAAKEKDKDACNMLPTIVLQID